jgi:hypothetical protein
MNGRYSTNEFEARRRPIEHNISAWTQEQATLRFKQSRKLYI